MYSPIVSHLFLHLSKPVDIPSSGRSLCSISPAHSPPRSTSQSHTGTNGALVPKAGPTPVWRNYVPEYYKPCFLPIKSRQFGLLSYSNFG
jgi:hypothetical protein